MLTFIFRLWVWFWDQILGQYLEAISSVSRLDCCVRFLNLTSVWLSQNLDELVLLWLFSILFPWTNRNSLNLHKHSPLEQLWTNAFLQLGECLWAAAMGEKTKSLRNFFKKTAQISNGISIGGWSVKVKRLKTFSNTKKKPPINE